MKTVDKVEEVALLSLIKCVNNMRGERRLMRRFLHRHGRRSL